MQTDTLFYHRLEERDQGKKIEDILRRRFCFSRKLIQRLKITSAVRLDGKTVYLTSRGCRGQLLAVDLFEPEAQNLAGEDLPLDILYEDAFFLGVNKPSGQIVHPVGGHVSGTLANAVVGYWQRGGQSRLFRPVFRIDRDTSGVILVAKNRFAHQQISALSEKNDVDKIYLGIVRGRLPEEPPRGTLSFPIRPKAGSKILQEIHPQGRPAQTEYRLLAADDQSSLLEFRLVTGRTHQIRVHCQGIGYPLLGDTLYGGDTRSFKRQALHAYRYSFCHPVTQEYLTLTAPLPADMGSFIKERWPAIVLD